MLRCYSMLHVYYSPAEWSTAQIMIMVVMMMMGMMMMMMMMIIIIIIIMWYLPRPLATTNLLTSAISSVRITVVLHTSRYPSRIPFPTVQGIVLGLVFLNCFFIRLKLRAKAQKRCTSQ